jgi:glycosyltransferase involved in cell wall biosynthesis
MPIFSKNSPDSKDVVCFPDALWESRLWTNRQHMMKQLSQTENYRVLFVHPPYFILSVLRNIHRAQYKVGKKPKSPFLVCADTNLWLLNSPLPFPNRFIRNWLPGLYDWIITTQTTKAMKQLDFVRPIIWTYSPFSLNHLGKLGGQFVLYDCVDDYPELPYYASRKTRARQLDDDLTRKANAVLCASTSLYEQKHALNSRTYMVGNAADVDLFAMARQPLAIPADLKGISKPIIGFHGMLDNYRIDYDLLRSIAVALPQWSLVLIGPVSRAPELDALAQLPNVHLLGSKPQNVLPAYVAQYDVGILPYKLTDHILRSSPLKVYEFLAAGKPVVSVRVPYIADLGVVYIADTPLQFVTAIQQAAEEMNASKAEQYYSLAAANNWSAKLQRIFNAVPELCVSEA